MFETEIPQPKEYKGPAWQYILLGGANLGLAVLGTGIVVGTILKDGNVDPIRPLFVLTLYVNAIVWLWRSRRVVPQAPTSKVLDIEKSE
jgi:hypothetical protein